MYESNFLGKVNYNLLNSFIWVNFLFVQIRNMQKLIIVIMSQINERMAFFSFPFFYTRYLMSYNCFLFIILFF